MNSSPRYLIASLGSIGRRHLRNLRALSPHSRIAALRHRRGTAADEHPDCDIQLYSLDEVRTFHPDAAIIAGPASTHAELAAGLIEMGVPVMIEKPFASSIQGLDRIIERANSLDVTLMVAYNLRFKPSLIEARRRILDGAIGEILAVRAEVGQYLPDWRPGSDYRATVSAQAGLGGGALLELSHEIDYVYWLFGLPARVSCRGGRYSVLEIDVEDMVELCLEYESPRRLVSIHLDFVQRVPSRTCKFIGTDGTLTWNGIADTIEIFKADAPSPTIHTVSTPDKNLMYEAELKHFLECVEFGLKPAIDAVAAFEVMAIVEAARSSMINRTVERPLPYEG